MNLDDAKNILNPENGFLADPFLLEKDNRTFCFVEEFSYKENKGKISASNQINSKGAQIEVLLPKSS